MTTKTIVALALALGLSAPAFAGHCPKDAKAVDHALMSTTLDADAKAKVQAMRDEGMKLHGEGKHADSEKVLAEAMRELLMAK